MNVFNVQYLTQNKCYSYTANQRTGHDEYRTKHSSVVFFENMSAAGTAVESEEIMSLKSKQKTSLITDMTEGTPIRLIMAFAVPLLIGNIFQQVYSLADTMIAGHYLGSDAIAAIGATSVLYSLLMNIAWGLNNGYCIVLSRIFGSGDRNKFKKGVAAMMELNTGIALVLTVLSVCFLKPMMRLLRTPADIFDQSYLYIVIILAGLVTTVAYNACAGYLRAMGNSRIPLYFLILSSLLNLGLDTVFIVVLGMGIAGTALATVIAQAVSALLCGWYIMKYYKEYLPSFSEFRLEREIVQEMFSTGFSMAMMQSVFSLGSVILQRSINELGTVIITAHTASRRVYELLMIPMSTFSNANSTFVGQNYGAKKYSRIIEANRKMLGVEFLWSMFSIAFSWILGRPLIMWLTASGDQQIISNALLNLRMSTACFFPLGALFVLRYSMQAMGHKVLPVLSSVIELLVKVFSAAVLVPAFGYLGVAVTEPVIWCICAVFLGVFYVTAGHQKQGKKSVQASGVPVLVAQ